MKILTIYNYYFLCFPSVFLNNYRLMYKQVSTSLYQTSLATSMIGTKYIFYPKKSEDRTFRAPRKKIFKTKERHRKRKLKTTRQSLYDFITLKQNGHSTWKRTFVDDLSGPTRGLCRQGSNWQTDRLSDGSSRNG